MDHLSDQMKDGSIQEDVVQVERLMLLMMNKKVKSKLGTRRGC